MTEATTEVIEQPVEPAVVENALNVDTPADPPATSVSVAGEPAEATEEPKEHGNKGKSPWYMRRLAEEADRARAAEEEAKNLKEMLDRLQSGKEEPAKPAPTQDVDAIVNARIAERDLQRDSNDILQSGLKDYGSQFNETVKMARALGIVSDDMVLDLAAVDKTNAHKILTELTTDPDRAELLARMNPRQRLAELTRISMAVSAPKTEAPKPAPAAKVSKAPAPPPPVEPSATKTKDWRTADSEEDFQSGWEAMMERRSKVRR